MPEPEEQRHAEDSPEHEAALARARPRGPRPQQRPARRHPRHLLVAVLGHAPPPRPPPTAAGHPGSQARAAPAHGNSEKYLLSKILHSVTVSSLAFRAVNENYILDCESTSRRFQHGGSPSRAF